jgi:hypothetical protein
MIKISARGNIDWVDVLPKKQRENVKIPKRPTLLPEFGTGAAEDPVYGSFGCFPAADDFAAAGPGYGKSQCYQLTLDMLTGKFSRRVLFTNEDILPAAPKLGVVIGHSLYLPGISDNRLGLNAKIEVGKISLER